MTAMQVMTPSDARGVLLEDWEFGAVWITINRSHKHNALARPVLAAIATAVTAAGACPDVRCVIVTGAGDRYFAAGEDLKDLANVHDKAATLAMMQEAVAALDSVRCCPVPVLAYLTGDAIGGSLMSYVATVLDRS